MIDLSCKDWREWIRASRSQVHPVALDENEARRAVAIFNCLRLPDVAGNPALVEAAGDWLREIAATLFGALADGNRLVREEFCLVPKKLEDRQQRDADALPRR